MIKGRLFGNGASRMNIHRNVLDRWEVGHPQSNCGRTSLSTTPDYFYHKNRFYLNRGRPGGLRRSIPLGIVASVASGQGERKQEFTPGRPGNTICPLWDDLNLDSGRHLNANAGARYLVLVYSLIESSDRDVGSS